MTARQSPGFVPFLKLSQNYELSEEALITENRWITWDGGDRPVVAAVEVEVRFRNGEIPGIRTADHFSWKRYGDSLDIVAFRIVKVL